MFNILIAELGRIGRRYLEGLSKSNNKLKIYLFDTSSNSLQEAKKCWKDVNCLESKHKLYLANSFDQIPKEIDLAIVSTTADVRVGLVKKMVEQRIAVRYWLLEKVLAQSPEQIDEWYEILKNACGVWVNTNQESYYGISNFEKFFHYNFH